MAPPLGYIVVAVFLALLVSALLAGLWRSFDGQGSQRQRDRERKADIMQKAAVRHDMAKEGMYQLSNGKWVESTT